MRSEANFPWPDQATTPPRPQQKHKREHRPQPAEPEKRFNPAPAEKVANKASRVITPAGKCLELPFESLLKPTTPLGIGIDADIATAKKLLVPGDLLIGFNRGIADLRDGHGKAFDLTRVLGVESSALLMKTDEILERLRTQLAHQGYSLERRDLAALLIQCRGKSCS
jgi:hypothetical protein